jgi:hypothetical protein
MPMLVGITSKLPGIPPAIHPDCRHGALGLLLFLLTRSLSRESLSAGRLARLSHPSSLTNACSLRHFVRKNVLNLLVEVINFNLLVWCHSTPLPLVDAIVGFRGAPERNLVLERPAFTAHQPTFRAFRLYGSPRFHTSLPTTFPRSSNHLRCHLDILPRHNAGLG